MRGNGSCGQMELKGLRESKLWTDLSDPDHCLGQTWRGGQGEGGKGAWGGVPGLGRWL